MDNLSRDQGIDPMSVVLKKDLSKGYIRYLRGDCKKAGVPNFPESRELTVVPTWYILASSTTVNCEGDDP